jgi:hypothetical protein
MYVCTYICRVHMYHLGRVHRVKLDFGKSEKKVLPKLREPN